VSVPPNSRALIYVPCAPEVAVYESGKAVVISRYEKGYAVVETGSGNYSFSVLKTGR
jgi:hypothetical protein